MNVDVKERQIAVTLQLKSFLCNTNNGEPTQWGVVVAQDELAKGLSPYDDIEIRSKLLQRKLLK